MQAYISLLLASFVACSLGAPQLDIGSRVINGENASPGEIPYIVSLRRSNSHFCGGSILNANWVITAAHCVVGTSASSVTVVTGTTTLNAGGDKHAVSRIITHSGYSAAASWRNDIALLKVSLRRSNSHFCGGSILNANWVITAAHCVVGTSASSVTVVTGTTTLNAGGDKHAVSRIITHSGYSAAASWRNDIALLKVASPIQLSSSVQPVKLPAANKDQGSGLAVLVSGWGYASYPGWVMPNNLQKLNLELVSNSDCQSKHKPTYTIYETSVCASAGNGKGVCNGDSGGPLVEAASGELVGIVSWGRPCAVSYPDVYTRVAKYIDWINENAVN